MRRACSWPKAACPAARVTAVERSPQALAIARANGDRLHLGVDWRQGDWWQPLAGLRFDVVVANPPYQGTSKLADDAYVKREYELGKADLQSIIAVRKKRGTGGDA